MNLLPDDQEAAMVSVARAVLEKEVPEVGRADPLVLLAKLGDLGWFALTLAPEVGGAGLSLALEALVFREVGRRLAPGPILQAALASRLAVRSGQSQLLTRLSTGTSSAAFAQPVREGIAVVGAETSGTFRVFGGGDCEVVVVSDGEQSVLVDASALSDRVPGESLDTAMPVEIAELQRARAIAIDDGTGAIRVADEARVLVGAVLAGICEATRDDSVDYAGRREQFGRPIGANQAVKHRCAEMAVRAEAAGALSTYAALSVPKGGDEARSVARASKAFAAENARTNASDNILNHGGVGFTEQAPAHRFLRRAIVLDAMLGTALSTYSAPLEPAPGVHLKFAQRSPS